MLKKTMTFTDYEGNERTEDHYFNLTRSECLKMEMSTNGGITKLITKLIQTQNMPEVMKIFENFLAQSYGEKSLDGRQFVKSPELFTAFSQTPAYDQLFFTLCTDADEASKFINAIIPNEAVQAAGQAGNNVVPMATQPTNQ